MRRGNYERGPKLKAIDPGEFTLAAHTPPRKPRRPRALTSQQVHDLAAWMKARREIGNNKTKAAELGITTGTLANYLLRIRRGDLRGRGET